MFHERARIVEPEQRIEIWRVCEEFPLARPPFTGATIVRFHRPFSCGRLHNAWHWHLSRYTRLPSLSFLISSLPHAARPLASAPGATLYGVIKFFLHRTFAKSASARSIVSSETPGTSCDTHRERERERERRREPVIASVDRLFDPRTTTRVFRQFCTVIIANCNCIASSRNVRLG